MRRLAVFVAAALVVSVPLLSTSSTESLGATKAKSKAKATQESGSLFSAFTDQLSGKSDPKGKKGKQPARKKKGG
jgi:hypothetical protein